MFDFFKKRLDSHPPDAKTLRVALLRFLKESLQQVEGGEGRHIKGLQLFVACSGIRQHLYEAALYQQEPGRFQAEVQKIADDFALELPTTWVMETTFVDDLPPEALKSPTLDVALFIRTRTASVHTLTKGYIRVLSGEAEQETYTLTASDGPVTIGRERKAQGENGFVRINAIAFPANSPQEGNRYISRQHAHIEWDNGLGRFMLFADEGGVPPRNKVKIKSAGADTSIKLYSTHIGHPLREADQIVLGESAVLEFSYIGKPD
ncbi:FHA domain-containing protein [Spirosoma luteum]|uniref:FHA domain-containing protein n=1 Tax=Spirosoma luteum TaxID=431553 RepID=UPI00039EDB52|nr:FHA domain-containing protein [Spirosoma luteum]